MATKPGSNESESPADDDQVEVDALEGAENPLAERNAETETEVEADPAPPSPEGDEPETETPKAAAKPKPSKPSAVDLAIEQMTTPLPDPDADDPGARKATDPAADQSKTGTPPAPKPATGEGQPNADETNDDPLHDWSPEERKHTKGKVKERFRTLDKQFREQQPMAEVGQGWTGFIQKHELAPDLNVLPDEGMVVAVRTQAAAIRVATAAREGRAVPDADVAWLEKNRDAIDNVLGLAGRKPKTTAEDTSKVEITQEVRDLKDAFGVVKDEDELRVVQAALNRHRGKTAAPGKPADEKLPAQNAPAARQAPAAPAVPWTDEDDLLAKAGMREDLVASGVPAAQVSGHFAKNLTPLVSARLASLYPGRNPDEAWSRLSPSNRRELVKQAQSTWSAKQKPANPPARARAPSQPPVSGTGSRAPLQTQRAATSGKGAVAATIAAMCGEEIE